MLRPSSELCWASGRTMTQTSPMIHGRTRPGPGNHLQFAGRGWWVVLAVVKCCQVLNKSGVKVANRIILRASRSSSAQHLHQPDFHIFGSFDPTKSPSQPPILEPHTTTTPPTLVQTSSQSHTSTSESSLLLDEFATTIRQERRRSISSTKLKKNRRSGYWNIGEYEVSHHFHGFDGDYCNTKKDKIIIMSRQYIQEPEKREVSKTGFHEPFCGDRNTTRPHPQAIIGPNAIITAENIPKLRHRNPSSFFSKRKGKATSHGKILMSEYDTSNVSSIAEETSVQENKLASKHKRDSGIHIDSMDSSRQSSSDKSDQSIRSRSSSSSSEDSAKSRSRRRKILSKFKF
ncbi:hypothetical protein HYALB_00003607 [Hymenoscyphus albidus]|uniref:Uncharacterized protein n=1 Tax=Hymenoscyphus albidus TaxID=595503 RepID=A0A9N9QC63_9HELO|nr:hypothetical protein HYALB_00003607 [Hymenoscyphus albidus]